MNALLASSLFVACALGFDAQTPTEKPPKAEPIRATVTGKVLFDGPRPEPHLLPATPEQAKGCCPDGKPVDANDPKLVIDAKLGIANVLVTIDVPDAKAIPPPKPYVVDQQGCVFEPHCTIVQAGSKVVFKNSDKVTHNVHINSAKNDSANDTIPAGGQKEYTFAKAEKIAIGCDYHPWMSSLLLVVDTPFVALTSSDGSFSIPDLKPGTYNVRLWHEVLGRAEARVVIKDDGTSAPLELKLSAPKPR